MHYPIIMMMKETRTMGPSETPCNCCGRIHRVLHDVNGYLLGQNCREDYRLYKKFPEVTSVVWDGWEKKYNKVAAMVNGG